MSDTTRPAECAVLQGSPPVTGKQGLQYSVGVSAETAGSQRIYMQKLTIPPGGRGRAHRHDGHETALFVLSGCAAMFHGEALERHSFTPAGSFVYIPAGVPHLPYNASSDEPCVAVVSRTDPREQESVVLTPELEALVPPSQSDWPYAIIGLPRAAHATGEDE